MPSTSVEIYKYADPLGLDDPAPAEVAKPQPVVTGLSDEEDAARHLALRFDRTLGFCRNCEGTYPRDTDGDIVMTTFCPRCHKLGINELLCVPGTPPFKAKQKR